jgi:hypothetical protein
MSKPKGTYSGAVLRLAQNERAAALAKLADPADVARRALASHERVIESAVRSFVDLGRALLAIRTERLYAAEFSTFSEYCDARWDISETHANRVINAALVAIEATPIGVEINSEAVARELVGLDPETLKQVWAEATRRAAGGRVTAALVKEVRKALERPAIEGEARETPPAATEPEGRDEDATDTRDPAAPAEHPTEDPTNEESGPVVPVASSSAPSDVPGVATDGAPAVQEESADSPPADEPERAGTGVTLPAPDLVQTPIGPMPRQFAAKLDQLVPDPNPHREWQAAFLADVFAAAKAMRGYTGAEIAAKADDQLRAEFAGFVADMDELLTAIAEAADRREPRQRRSA